MNFNYFDLLVLLVLLYGAWRGWQSGFMASTLDLLGWLVSVLVAFWAYEPVSDILATVVRLPSLLLWPLTFAGIVLATGLLVSLLSSWLLTHLPIELRRNSFNHLLGLFPGLLGALILVAILSVFLASFPFSGTRLAGARDSEFMRWFSRYTAPMEARLTPLIDQALAETVELITVHPDSGEIVELPYSVSNPVPVPALEMEMLELINAERAAAGLAPLLFDEPLRSVARAHSKDMFARAYFAHITPEGYTPFDRIKAAGIRYFVAGENLAHAPTLRIAHEGLMQSPGHRANILRPEFGRVGIGIMDGGRRGLMITQNFRE